MARQREAKIDTRTNGGEPRSKPRGDVLGQRETNARGFDRGERGAALVTVLLFMTLTFILITSMLTVSGNEVVISSLQRDGIRAVEFAQAGLNEAIKRMEEGRPYYIAGGSWTTSLDANTSVTVTRRVVGVSSGYMQISVVSTVGRSTRTLSALVLMRTLTFPPNITFAERVKEQGSADISDGDAYSRTFFEYKSYPSDPDTLTYTGWRVSKGTGGGKVGPCYTAPECATLHPPETTKWYPGTRLTENISSDTGGDIADQTFKCPDGGGGSLPEDQITGFLATDKCSPACTEVTINRYGFDKDTSGGTDYAVSSSLPCGLPYRYDIATFTDESDASVTRLFKKIVFEQWFEHYWQFCEAVGEPAGCTVALQYEKKSTLVSHPEFGMVPPFPDFSSVEGNYDRRVTCTGTCTVTSGDFGCKSPEMTCTPAEDRPIIVWLDGDSTTQWNINANLQGHGTLVVDGNLRINGTFEYWGSVIVNGTAENTLGGGNPKIHGGLVAQNTLSLSGNIEVDGGSSYTSVPLGRSVVTGKAWWER
jgi:hypothetical protein